MPEDEGSDRQRPPSRKPASGAPKVRLQRVLADAGIAARRVCETLIEEGHVTVNGLTVTRLPVFVNPFADRIEVDGKPVAKAERRLYLMLHKPSSTLVTAADEPGFDRTTVMQLVDHPSAPRLYPVGRLDFEATGLVLLTNDGELANRLTHPRFGVPKTYHITVKGILDDDAVAAIRTKLRLVAAREREADRAERDGLDAGPIARARPRFQAPDEADAAALKAPPIGVDVVRRDADRTLLEITLLEGKNRQIRESMRVLGLPIRKLTRVAMGPLQLKGLAVGRWRELTREEIGTLRRATAPARRRPPPPPAEGLSRRRRAAAARPDDQTRGPWRPMKEKARPARPSLPSRPPRPTRPAAPNDDRGGRSRGRPGGSAR